MKIGRRIKEYPRSLIWPFLFCCLADVATLNSQKSWLHHHFRVPAFNSFHRNLKNWIYSEYACIINDIDRSWEAGEYIEGAPIWVLWYQGEEVAPDVVRLCLESIRKNAGSHPVRLITAENLSDYITLPSFIIEKHKRGIISNTFLSDIIRFCLLYEYGGLWIDSTVFVHRPFEEWIFHMPFYSGRKEDKEAFYRYPCSVWTFFFFGAYKGNSFIKACRDILIETWQRHDSLPSYFFSDYIISTIRDHSHEFRKCLSLIPINNNRTTGLMHIINEEYQPDIFSRYVNELNVISKLSYKKPVRTYTSANKLTNYGRLTEVIMEDSRC